MRRRDVLALLGGAAAAPAVFWPRGTRAQQMRRVGVLMNGADTIPLNQMYLATFVQALPPLGWMVGKNLRLDIRWNDADARRAREYASELVSLNPDAILVASTTNLTATRLATCTIPIVFVNVSDPVVQGFVPSLMRPGGNITGFAQYEFSIAGKWLDLLKQMVPALARVTAVFNPDTSPQSQYFLRAIQTAAQTFGVEMMTAPVRSPAEIESAITGASQRPNGGLIFPTDSYTQTHGPLITELAARLRVPAIFGTHDFVEIGGLMYYGTADVVDQFRSAAAYVDRILKGARPGELPVQLPVKYSLTINLKAAKALGIDVPISLLLIADEQIE